MFYYLLKNFIDVLGNPDYKGLDISKNIAGSQVYLGNEAILANIENIPASSDLIKLSEAEYISLRASWLEQLNQESIDQRVLDLELAYAALAGGAS